jgi:Arc/MetJ-type ribon-helix-helix transcriptional regulator
MKTLTLQVPDRVAEAMEELVRGGWFADESELARQALDAYLQTRKLDLQERFQRDDIRWALSLKDAVS